MDISKRLLDLLIEKNMKIAVAESCTGGLFSSHLIAHAGASAAYDRGFIVYSNEAKSHTLGVSLDLINTKGAVSSECAEAMAKGALEKSEANLALSITGIAGPGGGSEDKPVGLVYIGYALKGGSVGHTKHNFQGDRAAIQGQSIKAAYKNLISILESE